MYIFGPGSHFCLDWFCQTNDDFLFQFCDSLGLDFLVVRVWAGVWLAVIAFVTVMLEGSFMVSYVTRFTEDIFAVLISAIFISESTKFVKKVSFLPRRSPILPSIGKIT